MTDLPMTIGVLVLAYLLGSIPFGLVLSRMAGLGDIRDIGSGNIGATNVLRTGNKFIAALTLLTDAAKGFIAVAIALELLGMSTAYWAGLAALLGHVFPVWLGFKGGKGVATCLATFAAFDIRLGIVFVALWLGTAVIFRYSSLAALVATMGCSIAAVWLALPEPVVIAVIVMSGLSWARHHQNIGRLLTGKESRIGKK